MKILFKLPIGLRELLSGILKRRLGSCPQVDVHLVDDFVNIYTVIDRYLTV